MRRHPNTAPTILSFLLLCILIIPGSTLGADPSPAPAGSDLSELREQIKGVELINQDGKKVKFYEDLVEGKVVAINFIFTSCPAIGPVLGASFAKLQNLLGERLGTGVNLISISVDPVNDTPERLKAWGAQFGATNPGWNFLTGEKDKIDRLRKLFKVFTPLIEGSPIILLVDSRKDRIDRISGFASTPAQISKKILAMGEANPGKGADKEPAQASPSQKYFPDLPLVDQDGKERKFYTDLIKGKVVVINSFFSTCESHCPTMMGKLQKIQEAAGDRMGKDVHIISITVDPFTDTPKVLKAYSKAYNAKPGWFMMTGDKETVKSALNRLGFNTEAKELHSNIFIIGNEPTGRWQKVSGNRPDEIVRESFMSVLRHRDESKP